jgi:hypothetical protein
MSVIFSRRLKEKTAQMNARPGPVPPWSWEATCGAAPKVGHRQYQQVPLRFGDCGARSGYCRHLLVASLIRRAFSGSGAVHVANWAPYRSKCHQVDIPASRPNIRSGAPRYFLSPEPFLGVEVDPILSGFLRCEFIHLSGPSGDHKHIPAKTVFRRSDNKPGLFRWRLLGHAGNTRQLYFEFETGNWTVSLIGDPETRNITAACGMRRAAANGPIGGPAAIQ